MTGDRRCICGRVDCPWPWLDDDDPTDRPADQTTDNPDDDDDESA